VRDTASSCKRRLQDGQDDVPSRLKCKGLEWEGGRERERVRDEDENEGKGRDREGGGGDGERECLGKKGRKNDSWRYCRLASVSECVCVCVCVCV